MIQFSIAVFAEKAKRWIRQRGKAWSCWPPVGMVRFGSLRRLTPISRKFGFDRGSCVDRYYIEVFLARHASDIRGHVLEIADDNYTRRFGGSHVTRCDVLHVVGNPRATIVADLTRADHIPSNHFDCVICTQTLPFIYDVRAAIKTLYRILKPGGVFLMTVPGISQISRYDMERWGDYWRFTTLSARRLCEEVFPAANITVKAQGNVLAAMAFLHGLAAQELRQEELDHCDPDYEVLITVRAVKPKAPL
jgi:SAM-dependent methyltransferase